jgi:hypothetical protein
VLAVLGNGDQGRVQSVRMASVWDADIATDYVFSGSRLLTLSVNR